MQQPRPLPDEDTWPNVDRCECGVLLTEHPPLPPVRPWGGWRSERLDDRMQRPPVPGQKYRSDGPGVLRRKRGWTKMSIKPERSSRWLSMTEEERAVDRAASKRYYAANREQIRERRRDQYAARKSA